MEGVALSDMTHVFWWLGPSRMFVPICLMSQQHIPEEHNIQPSYYIIVL